jgi:mRNA interferase RelE/StbE
VIAPASYSIQIKPSALSKLKKLPSQIKRRISEKIDSLAVDPRPPGVEKLEGADDLYRVRVGNYRIIYQIQDEILLIMIVKVGDRKEIYR